MPHALDLLVEIVSDRSVGLRHSTETLSVQHAFSADPSLVPVPFCLAWMLVSWRSFEGIDRSMPQHPLNGR